MTEPYLNPNQAKFAKKLSQYLDQNGRDPNWMAKKLGYKHRSIFNKWFDGTSKMPFEVLIQFCKLCELDKAQAIELSKLAGYEKEVSFIVEMLKEDKEDIFKKFDQKSGPLRQYIRVQEFQTLVNERTQVFVGRQFIFQAIDALLANPQLPSGYIVIQGEPGIGKTALLAQLVKQRGYVHHFNIAVQNIRSTRDFLTNICAQLIVEYKLPYLTLPQEATQDSGFLSRLLTETVSQAGGKSIVILVDALDEVEDHSLPAHMPIASFCHRCYPKVFSSSSPPVNRPIIGYRLIAVRIFTCVMITPATWKMSANTSKIIYSAIQPRWQPELPLGASRMRSSSRY